MDQSASLEGARSSVKKFPAFYETQKLDAYTLYSPVHYSRGCYTYTE